MHLPWPHHQSLPDAVRLANRTEVNVGPTPAGETIKDVMVQYTHARPAFATPVDPAKHGFPRGMKTWQTASALYAMK